MLDASERERPGDSVSLLQHGKAVSGGVRGVTGRLVRVSSADPVLRLLGGHIKKSSTANEEISDMYQLGRCRERGGGGRASEQCGRPLMFDGYISHRGLLQPLRWCYPKAKRHSQVICFLAPTRRAATPIPRTKRSA